MMGISFLYPWVLLALALVPVAFVAWIWGTKRAVRRARAVSRTADRRPAYAFAVLLSLAAFAAIFAAAQPRWGTKHSSVPRHGAELMVVMDISRSMDATDTRPSRLQAAKTATSDTIARLEGDRVGLVVFAGSARLRFPLTSDLTAATQVIQSLQAGAVFVEGGTNASVGLDTALSAFDFTKPAGRAVLFISDGDDLGSDPSASATRLRAAGVDLLVVGAGTSAGSTIPVTNPATGTASDKAGANGEPIVTKLNEPFLRALAGAGGGRYLGSDLALVPGIIDGRLRSLQSTVIDERSTTIPIERYQWFAAAALALLVLASLTDYIGRRISRRGIAVATASLLTLLLAGCASSAYSANEAGREALRNGDASRAVALFQEAAQGSRDDPRLALNLAAALNAAGRFDEAILAARRALTSSDPTERARAYASIGHHEFSAGHLPESLDAFKHALLEDPADDASRHDYEVVLRLLQPPDSSPQPGSPGATPPASPSPQPDSTPDPNASPTPGPGDQGPPNDANPNSDVSPRSDKQIEQQLNAIDGQVKGLLGQSGNEPNAQQALEILRLLAERSRIAAQRDSGTQSGPNDY